ncbi:cryptococcal mannosyltransferase 1-domain-containing protein [Aspergillus varians]
MVQQNWILDAYGRDPQFGPKRGPSRDNPRRRFSVESQGIYETYDAGVHPGDQSLLGRVLQQLYSLRRLFPSIREHRGRYKPLAPVLKQPRYCRRFRSRLLYYALVFLSFLLVIVLFTSVFYPSYTRLPPHYSSLRDLALKSNQTGRANLRNEQVFIASSLYDPSGEIARGHWGSSILQLIDLLGEDNVFLSIYENDSGDEGKAALERLDGQIPCNKSIVYEHLDLDELPKVTIPGGAERVKRITYLAETRNRALRPLDEPATRFDKLLYLNDVAFDPIDALQLLFSTNVDDNGIPQYRAACAVDFDNPFKFYDTYATRDLEGYSMGLPFFPWFSDAGSGQSRRDVLAGKDAVPVRSCWGGMVAFDAQFFQSHNKINTSVAVAGESLPARFRALQDPNIFWDASECCLIHADIQIPWRVGDNVTETGIYMNPFVRVAYDTRTLSWLWTTRRFEKLYSIIHNIGDHLVGLPWFNPRLREAPRQSVQETVFVTDGKNTSLQTVERIARHDGFCGRLGLQVVPLQREKGHKGWQNVQMPRS